jgi:MYXO-CTERM domain-containing protein
MKMFNITAWLATIGFLVLATSAQALPLTFVNLNNGAADGIVGTFGVPDSQTYGQVVTAPVTGTLTSFTLSLENGVGALYGGVAGWSGGASFATGGGSTGTLFTSPVAPSVHTTTAAYTFSPNVAVTSGSQYVVYLSTNLANGTSGTVTGASGLSYLPTVSTPTAGFDYFVWNNSVDGSGPQSPVWNYFSSFGNAQASVSYSCSCSVSPVPLPSTLPLLALGVVGLMGFAYRRQTSI